MSRTLLSATFASFGLLVLSTLGCGDSGGLDAQQLTAYRTKYTLDEEPDGIQTVADVRLALLGEEAADHDDHDHDGDGKPDHAPEDHDAHEHDEADHDEADHADHADSQAAHADEEESEEHADHVHDEHAAEDQDNEGHSDHSAEEHEDHAHEHDHDHAHETEPQEVVMVGHIGGLANPWAESYRDYPFQTTEAVFFLADPQAVIANEEAGHKHAPGEECAFCAAHAADQADMLAMVRFVDEKGKVLRTDARKLFDVKEQDTVVVSGKAHVTAGGILVVDAQGLYVRK